MVWMVVSNTSKLSHRCSVEVNKELVNLLDGYGPLRMNHNVLVTTCTSHCHQHQVKVRPKYTSPNGQASLTMTKHVCAP